MNVNQPNGLFQGNETIIEETNEADDSIMHNSNTRFSQRFQDTSKVYGGGNDDEDVDYY